jgi:hypothetical protein
MRLQLNVCAYRNALPQDPTCTLERQGGLIGREGGDDISLVLRIHGCGLAKHARVEYRQEVTTCWI